MNNMNAPQQPVLNIQQLQGLNIQQLQVLQVQLHMQYEQAAGVIAMAVQALRQRQRRRRRFWMRPFLSRRVLQGQYENLMAELMRESRQDFRSYLRMEPLLFLEIVERLTPRLTKATTNWRRPLEPGLKVAVTLRFFATGNSFHSLAFEFRVAHNTISLFVRDVINAIIAEYADEVVQTPTTPDGWRLISDKFGTRWNFWHACGALDGKHIAVKAPANSGTVFHNYKGFFSIIMLALVDADYKFMWIDVGANGSTSDCAVFNVSELKEALDTDTLGLPAPEPLPGDDREIPYFFVGDDAFPLRTYMMKPFAHRRQTIAERIFNYRLSRARRIVENAFGILANRFRVLLSTINMEPEVVSQMAMACVCLHNILCIRYPAAQNRLFDYEGPDHNLIPGAWREEGVLREVEAVRGGNRATRQAKQQRIYLKHYLNTIGAVPWQRQMI
jgi:hypothetical protein